MPRGSKPGERRGGRKKGTPNRVQTETKAALQQYITEQVIVAERTDFDPVEAIQEITRWAQENWRKARENGEEALALTWADRVTEWGKQAAPYIRPRLNAVEARVNVNVTIYERIERSRRRVALAA